jgi:hypothetical protein
VRIISDRRGSARGPRPFSGPSVARSGARGRTRSAPPRNRPAVRCRDGPSRVWPGSLQGMQVVGDAAVGAGLATASFSERDGASSPTNSSFPFTVWLTPFSRPSGCLRQSVSATLRLLCAGFFIGDAAPAVLPHLRIGTVYPAQPAPPPLLQAHRFPFPKTLRSQGGQP